MPNRLIKESICTSDNLNELSWFEECVFYRLIVNCDDYGRFDARPAIVRSRLFPLKSVTDKQVDDALKKLSTVGIIELYEYNSKVYLQFVTWNCHQRIRNKKSKYPAPEDGRKLDSNLQQIAADCSELPQTAAECGFNPIQSESNPNPNPGNPPYPPKGEKGEDPLDSLPAVLREKVEEWLEYKRQRRQPYKPMGLKTLIRKIINYADLYGETPVAGAIDEAMANGWSGIVWDKISAKEKKSGNQFLDMLNGSEEVF